MNMFDQIAEARILRVALHGFRLVGVEPAAEGDHFDALLRRRGHPRRAQRGKGIPFRHISWIAFPSSGFAASGRE